MAYYHKMMREDTNRIKYIRSNKNSNDINININININKRSSLNGKLSKGKVIKYWSVVKRHLIDTGDIYQDEHLVYSGGGVILKDNIQDPIVPVYQPTSSDDFINKKLFQNNLTAAQIQKRKQEDLEIQVKNEIFLETSEQRLKRFTRGYRRSQNMEITPPLTDSSASLSSSSGKSGTSELGSTNGIRKWGTIQLKRVIIPLDEKVHTPFSFQVSSI
ncbi:uncharacterized protein Ecym_3546 [Eremothecium cymbalariae DBVPG|uniref:Uncharacterized protein n=1 Tax=Eremothecium cymbalariae (strain CBS 270.75 / DBVPG 7215 / KCTC 17166 / NRRL Y-17582) TaxID=931890 RepID=G8JQN6_ERECY|nr:Hypothetical protein Ecym_3546 [Eremothecium cymbalariae DBVPG\